MHLNVCFFKQFHIISGEQKIRFAKNVQHTYIVSESSANANIAATEIKPASAVGKNSLKITVPTVFSYDDIDKVATGHIDQTLPRLLPNSKNLEQMKCDSEEREKLLAKMEKGVKKQRYRLNRKQQRSALYFNENFNSKPWDLISR